MTYGRPAEDVDTRDFRVILINSDFHIGFEVNRDRLYRLLATQFAHLMTNFEPCIYPGVKIRYSWNQARTHHPGACPCSPRCNGTAAQACCQRITIVIFRSGCIVITGARDYAQLDDAYVFISSLLHENRTAVERITGQR